MMEEQKVDLPAPAGPEGWRWRLEVGVWEGDGEGLTGDEDCVTHSSGSIAGNWVSKVSRQSWNAFISLS